MPISQTEGYFENPYYSFLEEPILFRWLWLENETFKKKRFAVLRQKKTNPNFGVKLAERSSHPFLLSILVNHIFQTFVLIMECIELNWLCKHINKIRSSQPAIPVLNHGVIILNRSNNSVFPYLKIYWNRQVFDLIRASGIWMKPETLRHQASFSKF